MQHYFGSVNSFGEVELDNDSLHHLLSVKRATVGEEIELSDKNITYRCKIKLTNIGNVCIYRYLPKAKALVLTGLIFLKHSI